MTKEVIYHCNICDVSPDADNETTPFVGFRWDGFKKLVPEAMSKADFHLCKICRASLLKALQALPKE